MLPAAESPTPSIWTDLPGLLWFALAAWGAVTPPPMWYTPPPMTITRLA